LLPIVHAARHAQIANPSLGIVMMPRPSAVIAPPPSVSASQRDR